jgi:hypothetical protein
MSYERMKMRIDTSGNTIRQSKINDARFMFEYEFKNDPSYNMNYHFCDGVKVADQIDIRLFENRYSAANGFTQKFAVMYDDALQVGDMIYDSDTKCYWLCTESYNKNEIYYSGKLVRCINNKMRWQDKNGKVFEYPVFEINSTQYNSGESGDKTMTLGSSQHLITVIADENTINLNHGQRFFWDRNTIDPTVFKITQNDTTAMNYDKGLLKITIMEDQYDPNTDSIEHWLCDYFPTSTETITIIYSGNPTIRIGGTKTLKVESDMPVVWSVESEIGATITPNGKSVKVKCPSGDFVEQKITVKAESNGVVGECVLTVTGGV